MAHIRNWLITKLLSKDKLVAVPEKWQIEYVKMAGNEARRNEVINTILEEYNNLLKDYFNKCSAKELQDVLKDGEIEFKAGTPKKELADLAYEEFRMTIER